MTFAVLFTCSFSCFLSSVLETHWESTVFKHNGSLFYYLLFWGNLPNTYYNLIFPFLLIFFLKEGKEIILEAPFLRLLSELMMAHVCLDQGSFICVFLTKHLFYSLLQRVCWSWSAKSKEARQTLGGMLSSGQKINGCSSGERERESEHRQCFACQCLPIVSQSNIESQH